MREGRLQKHVIRVPANSAATTINSTFFRITFRNWAATYKWQFAPRFRRNAFSWKSDTPIQRIKEALVGIKAVAKKGPVLSAEDAVLFLDKLAPAIEQVDSSPGGIGYRNGACR
jgi:hypothetical protein